LAVRASIEEGSHHLQQAIDLNEQAIALAMEHGHVRLAGLLHGNLGGTLLEIGDFDQSERHHLASLRMSREIGSRMGEANALGGVAGVYGAQERWNEALAAAREGAEVATASGDRYSSARWLLRQGHALAALGRTDEAIEIYRRADALARSTGAAAATLDPQTH